MISEILFGAIANKHYPIPRSCGIPHVFSSKENFDYVSMYNSIHIVFFHSVL